jgi:type IV secretion system protein VirB6
MLASAHAPAIAMENAVAPRRASMAAAAMPVEVLQSQGGGEGGSRSGERRTLVTQVSGGGLEPIAASSASRAKGIGSRFRASNDTAKASANVPGRTPKEMIR